MAFFEKFKIAIILAVSTVALPAQAGNFATLTFTDNPIQIIRNTQLLKTKSGFELQKGDIVETGISSAQIEVSPDTLLVFSPETKAYLGNPENSSAACAEVYLIQGWVKALTKKSSPGGCVKIISPLLGVLLENGASIVHVSNNTTEIFAEDSEQTITALGERGKAGDETKVSREQYAARQTGQAIKVLPRPPKTFIAEMPLIFRDQITPTANRLKNTKVEAEFIRDVDYLDIEAWLKSNIAPRSSFVNRFMPRLKDANFRKSLDAQLGKTPDWKNILHPPQKPKNPAASPIKSNY